VSKGRQQHAAHQAAISALGRQISRRAKNKCELCEDHTSLKVVEVEPVFEAPDVDRAVMVCERCVGLIHVGKRGIQDPGTLRFLELTVWAEVLPAQLAAVRATRLLSAGGVDWATELLDGLYLDDDTAVLLGG
jgi:protein PhnA